MTIERNINLAKFTTFGIGGEASFFTVAKSVQDVLDAYGYAREHDLRIFLLGGGSNVLISDQGFDGLVIKNELKGFTNEGNYISVAAGESWDETVQKVIALKFQGIECLSGVPGTFGGAIVQNIGAYGQTLSDVVDSVEVLDTIDGKVKILSKPECEFEYRNSLFKKNSGRHLVLQGVLKLFEIDRGNISFLSLGREFVGENPSLSQVRQKVLTIRASKGMVIMPEYESYKSAGSFFKNPVVSETQFEKFKASIRCPDPWYWNQSDGVKVSAACLITQAGFSKGQVMDAAQISSKQALAIINPGNAKASDIKNLAEKIKAGVRNKFGVELEEEIVYI
ncbi:MAG TPA: UDP-N-acetylmuramate dehydrogenase [Patescibacteria group bacterium]|nr:UDP-N-acetylmuramate dehydrogenase [Patescibacteria group bacterium]